MKYEIKNFDNHDGQKLIGFFVTDDNGNKFVIDKTIPIVEGKSVESYLSEAIVLCQNEIDEWQSSIALVGRTWNPETNSLE